MANSKKVNKGLSYKTKSKVILGVVIALLILIVGGYFVYYTGLPARVIPAVKIVQVVDGKEVPYGKIYTPELNYYRNNILSMYSMYGMSLDEEYLNNVNEEKGKTNGQLIYDSAAEQIVSVRLIDEKAKADAGFYSGASRFAEYQLYMYELRAKNNNFPTVGQYLAGVYGSGMTPSTYVKIVRDQEMSEEYQEYLKQTAFVPTAEEVAAQYDGNADVYTHVDFNWFFFSADAYDDAIVRARAVKAAALDQTTFNTAVQEQLDETVADQFDPQSTYMEGVDKQNLESRAYPEEMSNYILNKENKLKAEVFETDNGAYVVLPIRVYAADDPIYSYRKIVLNNVDIDSDDYTQEELIAGIEKTEKKANDIVATITDEESFIKAVKDNTENYDDITTGGYVNGVLTAQFEDENIAENDKKLGEWLLDPARKHGDMIVIRSYSNRMVTIYFFDEVCESWQYEISSGIVNTKANEWLSSLPTSTTVPQISYDVADKLTYYAQ